MTLVIPPKLNIAAWCVDRPAAEHPQRVAICGEPSPVTYGELQALVNRAGNALRASGCAPGHRVLIVLPDSAEFMAAFFGAAKIGAVAVPVNPMTRAADYTYYLADCSPQTVIVHAYALPEFLPACSADPSGRQPFPLPKLVVVYLEGSHTFAAAGDVARAFQASGIPPASAVKWTDWIAGQAVHLEAADTSCEDSAFFLYTSGSGGQPKAAVHQHKDMLVCAESYAKGVLGLRADDITFSVSKLFFAYGLGNGMYFPFSVGASTVLNPERPKPEKVLELVKKHRPTVFFSVPTFYAALLRAVDGVPSPRDDFSSVRMAVSAGEALPPEIFEKFRQRFELDILDSIGSTEMLQMFIANRPGQARAGTCGVPLPNYEATIVDESSKPVRDGEIGNLWVKGQSAFAGYWNKPDLSALARAGEWVITGDKFFRDADGYYHYCGRADDMIKASGMWVSPGEVENVLLGHRAVAEAAVVGAKDASGLLRPVAFVVLRDASVGNADLVRELQEFVRARLATYKCPQEMHFLSELPKTATGKIQRFKLRE